MTIFNHRQYIEGKNLPKVKNAATDAVVYLTGDTTAVAFSGKRSKCDFNLRFTSTEKRDIYTAAYLAHKAQSQQEDVERKAQARAERKAWKHDFFVGAILHYSWGYDQTNCEFYQVVSLKAKAIIIRRIAGALTPDGGCGPMSGSMVPCPDNFIEAEEMKIPKMGYKGNSLVSMEFGIADKWDGRPCYTSWDH